MSVIDVASGSVGTLGTLPAGATGIGIAPDGTRVYVVGDSVTLFYTNGVTPPRTEALPQSATALAVGGNGNVYLASDGKAFLVPMPSKFAVTATVVGTAETPYTAAADSAAVYVSGDAGVACVTRIDLSAPHVVQKFGRDDLAASVGIALSPSADSLYLTHMDGSFSVFDTVSQQLVAGPIALTQGSPGVFELSAIGVTPDGSQAYVSSYSARGLYVIDTTSNTVVAGPIDVGSRPHGIAFGIVRKARRHRFLIDDPLALLLSESMYLILRGPNPGPNVAMLRDEIRAAVSTMTSATRARALEDARAFRLLADLIEEELS